MTKYDEPASRERYLDDRPEPYLLSSRRPIAGVVLGSLAAGLYVLSFFLQATNTLAGWQAFIFALLFVIGIPMWLANVVFWIGLYHLSHSRYGSASTAGFIALLLALSESWLFGTELAIGYYVWVSSMAVLAAARLFREEEARPKSWWPRTEWLGTGEAGRIASRFRR